MTVSQLIDEISKNHICYVEEACNVLSLHIESTNDYEDYQEEADKHLNDLAKSICVDEVQLIGSADAIHNLSVEFARNGYFDYACAILKKGLMTDKFPQNIDLLADFIKYSTCSLPADSDLAEVYYQRLIRIDKKCWNWRAFSFSIDYLTSRLDQADEQADQILEECLKLASEYVKRKGKGRDGDRAYHALANVYLRQGDDKRCQSILQKALAQLKRAPICALQLSEIFFNSGLFEEADRCIRQCISMNINVDNSINIGYPYILSSLCRIMSAYKKSEQMANGQEKRDILKLIERDYESAKTILGEKEQRVRNLKSQIDILKKQIDMNDGSELFDE